MRNRFLKLFALLMALALLGAGLALAEDGLEIDGAIGTEEIEAQEGAGASDDLAQIDLDGAALVAEAPAANAAANTADVKIDSANFPAKAFRSYVKKHFDANGDGKLSQAEADAVTEIHLRTYDQWEKGKGKVSCANLKGIEHFRNLKILEAVGCGLNELDVSGNTKLQTLFCSANSIKKLDVSKNTKLKVLHCYENQLTKLNVTKNTKLVELDCSDNQLTALNVTKNTALKQLQCGGNQLKKLDVTKNAKLELLHCWVNHLSKLDVSKNKKLKELRFFANDLKTLDISKNTNLTHLNCGGNQLKTLNTSKNPRLVQINCYNNQLKSLDVSKNPKLIYLHAYGNSIKTIDLKNCKTLRGYLKNKVWCEDKFIAWSYEGDDELWGMSVDYSTTLTNGNKVLYQGE